jgi:acetyl esterase/lipase
MLILLLQLAPTVADFAYGTESERQKLDLWLAKSESPTPLVLMIHGGGWKQGDKSGYHKEATLRPYLDAGISVAAINYRFIAQAMDQKVEPPVKACALDAARALQTLRSTTTSPTRRARIRSPANRPACFARP